MKDAFFHMFKQYMWNKNKNSKMHVLTKNFKFTTRSKRINHVNSIPLPVILDIFGSALIPVFIDVILSLWNWKKGEQLLVEHSQRHGGIAKESSFIVAETIIHNCFDFRGVAGF